MLSEIFRKKNKYATINVYNKTDAEKSAYASLKREEKVFDDDMRVQCPSCKNILLKEDIKKYFYTCPNCGHHFRIGARDRLNLLLDKDSFIEDDHVIKISDPLNFPGYQEKLEQAKSKTGEKEGVITGIGKINNIDVVICVMDAYFMMGSMGCVVGERITRAIDMAIEKRMPVIIFSASGGARMQEGILSLMQMAKTSAALSKLSDENQLFLSVLTDPTTGGVTASFAMLGDIIIAEPGALIGFAGPRVIEQTIRQKLPEGFQSAEFLREKGFVDKIVHRKDLKETLYKILCIHMSGGGKAE
ncbi:MAG: acetyl-CoA carboxylase, carboxyltransferase subunit beta [Bacillota bacterium]